MAIKFEDDKREVAVVAAKRPMKPTLVAEPLSAEPEAVGQLPFAKPTRAEKKRKGR